MSDLIERLRTHRGTAWENELDAADEIERLRADAERWQMVADKLPVTADGMPIVPGVLVWFSDLAKRDTPIVSHRVTGISKDGFTNDVPYYVYRGKSPVFSTQRAAKIYRAEVLQERASQAAIDAAKEVNGE